MLIVSNFFMYFDNPSLNTFLRDEPEFGVISNPIILLISFQCRWRIPGLHRHLIMGIFVFKVKRKCRDDGRFVILNEFFYLKVVYL